MVDIKINTLPTASAKKQTTKVSKSDFMEKLESFLEKNKKVDVKDSQVQESLVEETDDEEVQDIEEIEEDFDLVILLNLANTNQLNDQPVEIKTDFSVGSEITKAENELSSLVNLFEAVNEDSIPKEIAEMLATVDQTQSGELLVQIKSQMSENPEMELATIVENILSENKLNAENYFNDSNLKAVENNSQNDELISAELELPEISKRDNEFTTINIQKSERYDMKTIVDEGIEETVVVREVEPVVDMDVREMGQEVIVEEQPVDLLNSSKTFEPVNRTTFVQEVSTTVQQVAQEEFVSNVETLIIEQTEAANMTDNVTTARMQLTPERLGKVSLQLEMTGKELTAKLIVEQHETKEWIDQQVAHLKEKLLTQEITVTEFQVVVDENPSDKRFMSNEENPFFKQKEKDSQQKRKQRMTKAKSIDTPVKSAQVQYADTKGVSLFV